MKTITLKLIALALLPAATLVFTSCSTEPKAETPNWTASQYGVPGGVKIETRRVTATVTGIDRATRKVTLVTKDGTKTSFIAGPEVANFAQLEVGDQVKATVTAQLVVSVGQPGESPEVAAAGAVALAPVGDKPGGVMAETVVITAKINSLNVKRHEATLLLPDGTTKTFKVRPDVDLTKHRVGDVVVIRATAAIALTVEKP